MTENEVAAQIVDVAFKIHTTYGPGLLESVYEKIMAYELHKRGLRVRRQQGIPVFQRKHQNGPRFSSRLNRRGQCRGRNQIRRSYCSSSQETIVDLPSTRR